jgi:malonate decarboxylase epsilon subunit
VMTTSSAIREDLALNMAHPVRWYDIASGLQADMPDVYLEAPPGHTLTNLFRQSPADIHAFSAADMRWDALVRAAKRANA